MLTISADSVFNVQAVFVPFPFPCLVPAVIDRMPIWVDKLEKVRFLCRFGSYPGIVCCFPCDGCMIAESECHVNPQFPSKIYIFEFLCSDFVCLCNGIGID